MAELGRPAPAEAADLPRIPLCLVLDDIRSANNVGSLFRTADGLGLAHVYCCGITATPPHRDILKTALGATETVPWSYREDASTLVAELTAAGTEVYALEQAHGSVRLSEFRLPRPRPLALVVGNEVNGVGQAVIDHCAGCLEIAQFGVKHSLNVAVAAGIATWALSGQLRP